MLLKVFHANFKIHASVTCSDVFVLLNSAPASFDYNPPTTEETKMPFYIETNKINSYLGRRWMWLPIIGQEAKKVTNYTDKLQAISNHQQI